MNYVRKNYFSSVNLSNYQTYQKNKRNSKIFLLYILSESYQNIERMTYLRIIFNLKYGIAI